VFSLESVAASATEITFEQFQKSETELQVLPKLQKNVFIPERE